MNLKIFDQLFMSGLSNDSAFPYWVYHTEHVGLDDLHYLKVYFFNRLFDRSTLDVVTLDYAGKEYRSLSFSQVSEYNDPDIVGCVIEISEYDPTAGIRIVSEVVDRKVVEPSGEAVRYVKSTLPKEDDYYRKKLPLYEQREIFPQIRNKYWQCSCGRIHSSAEEKCICGRSKDDISGIINFDVTESKIQDFLAVPFVYDTAKSFEDNLERNKQRFAQTGLDPALLEGRIDIETEHTRYDDLCAKKRAEDAKKKKTTKRIIITIASIVLLAAAGFVGKVYAYPAIKYALAERAFEGADYEKAIAGFESLGEYKDSSEKIKEVKLAQANALLDQNEYDHGIEILNELKTSRYVDDNTVNSARARKAQYLFDDGNYRDASAELKDFHSKNSDWNNLWNEATYQYALQLENDHNYKEAIDQYYEIKGYNDAESRRDELCYAYSAELFDAGQYISAKEYLQKIATVDRSSDVYKETMYQAGLQQLKNNNYPGAIDSFKLISGYKDADAQINETKYQYVVSHKNSKDNTTYTYLKDLRSIGYKDSGSVYSNLYAWYISDIVANSSESNKTTDYSSISKNQTAYFHFTLYGGEPNARASITATVYYSTGQSNSSTFPDTYYSGANLWYSIWWERPGTAPSSNVTVTIYVNGVAVGSRTISRP